MMSNRKAAMPKIKDPIKIRFKQLKNGNKSIYLAHWNRNLQKWEYEHLKELYIVPDSGNPNHKAANSNTLQLVKKIQAQRIVELQNNVHGFTGSATRSKVNVIDYIKMLAEKKREKAGNYRTYLALVHHIQQYSGEKTTFQSIDKKYCEGFLEYLKTATRCNAWGDRSALHQNTQWSYMKKLETVLNTAISDEVITVNPFRHIKSENKPEKHGSEVCFLTVDELQTLKNTPMYPPVIKQAFLFSCYTGLRFSDVIRLTWGKLQKDNNGDTFINFVQTKTDKQEYLPVVEKAIGYLPERNDAKASDTIFRLPTNKYTNVVLKNWAFAVGISKKVTFHVARHTYATLLLSVEVPIEVVSKNLGHAEIRTTQIYAKVVHQAQREAVNRLNDL